MNLKSGYFKKLGWVNLTEGKMKTLSLPDAFLERYIGGRGFGAKLVWDNLRKHGFNIDPLGEENILVIAPGPLTGLYLPSSGKCSFAAISPATGIYGDSSIGGSFGVELRQAGLDALVISGKAKETSFVFIDRTQFSIETLPELNGKTCLETEGIIKEYLGQEAIKMISIGIAGENKVRYACVNSDWSRNAGRSGMGAIMGSKNLKAVVIRGSDDLPVNDIQRLMEETQKANKYLKNHKFFKLWQEQGLMNVIQYANDIGILPTYNFKDACFRGTDKINGTTMLNSYKIADSACFACAMSCGNICLVKEGKYKGTATEGPEYESAAMLGSNLGIENFSAILKANYLCDEYGMDTISTGNLIAATIEGYQNSIISLEDLNNTPLSWGDEESILDMIRKIAYREGFGNILADGSYSLLKHYPEMEPYVLHVKGMEQSAYDSRASLSMALGYATSDIGAHHTRAWTIAKEIESGQDWTLEEKAELVIYHQKLRPLFDMLGVCRLPWIELGLNEKHYSIFYSAATGWEQSLDDLLERSNEIYNLTRLINTKLGITRKDDTVPKRMYNDPVQTGATAGKKVNMEDFSAILSLYYKIRNWDSEGVPSKNTEEKHNDFALSW